VRLGTRALRAERESKYWEGASAWKAQQIMHYSNALHIAYAELESRQRGLGHDEFPSGRSIEMRAVAYLKDVGYDPADYKVVPVPKAARAAEEEGE